MGRRCLRRARLARCRYMWWLRVCLGERDSTDRGSGRLPRRLSGRRCGGGRGVRGGCDGLRVREFRLPFPTVCNEWTYGGRVALSTERIQSRGPSRNPTLQKTKGGALLRTVVSAPH